MKKIILLLAVILTMNLIANPFDNMNINPLHQVVREQVSQKFIYARRAAVKGNVRAQFDLGLMYARGEGVRKNERLAFKWFHKAARNNHVEAKFYMGLSFAQGRGVRKQTQLARYWFKQAVKAGNLKAVAFLASIEKKLQLSYGRGQRIGLNTYR